MNSRTLSVLLILSLCINCAAAGALVHCFFFDGTGGRYAQPDQGTRFAGEPPADKPAQGVLKRRGRGIGRLVRSQREHIRTLQDDLIDQMMEDRPDREAIFSLCESISQHQAALQKSIVEKILEDIKNLPPERKKQYLTAIKKRMQRGGPGGGGRRHSQAGRMRGSLPDR
jgi:hypothetical protein